MAEVVVRGLKELEDTLMALPVEIAGPIARASLRIGAKVYEDGLRRRLPAVTGTGRAAIQVTVRRDRRWGWVAWIGPTKRAFYLRFLEWGTRSIAARGYARATLDEDAQIAIASFAVSMRAKIEAATRRLRKRGA